MEEIRRQDEHRVDRRIGDQRLRRCMPVLHPVALRHMRHETGRHIGHRRDLEARVVSQQRQVHQLRNFTKADQANSELCHHAIACMYT